MMIRCLSLLRRPRSGRFLPVLAVAGLLAGLMAIASPVRAGEARMAMVVGNADYDALAEVPQAARGARGVAETLEAQGFEVSLLLNGDAATFAAAFDSFERRAGDAAMVLFYFAGHGLRVDGTNRLAPIDLRPDAADAARGVALAPLMDRLATGRRPAVILLDANRGLGPAPGPGVAPGLGVPAPAREALVAMATQPGSLTPEDGTTGLVGDLRDALAVPGQPLEQVLRDFAQSVGRASDGRQTPWIRSSLSEPLFLRPFAPDEADFDRLAAMPEARQTFLLDIWRSQGARLDEATLARRLGRTARPAQAVALTGPGGADPGGPGSGDTGAGDTGAGPAAEAPGPAAALPEFSFEYIEEETPPAARPAPELDPATRETPQPEAPVAAATPAREAEDTVTVAALSPPAAGAGAGVADTPISRIPASRERAVPAALDPDRRLIGKDVTDLFLVPDDLPRAVQTELARLGCYRAGIDGIWGGGSRRALRDYIARSGADLDGQEPTEAVWRDVKAASGTICPAPAPRRTQPAPARTNRTTTASPPAPAPAPAPAPSRGNGDRLRGALGGAFR